jgi:hypothetical protein
MMETELEIDFQIIKEEDNASESVRVEVDYAWPG